MQNIYKHANYGINRNDKHSQKPGKKISFKGLTIETRDDGSRYHSFYLPATGISSDNLKLEVVPVQRTPSGEYEQADDAQILSPSKEKGMLKIWVPTGKNNSPLNIEDSSILLAYRFLNGGKPILDEVREEVIDDTKYNLSWDPSRPDIKKARTIYHLMPDMIKPKEKKPVDRRSHFNVFGGTIQDITSRIDYISEMGATRILSTPVFNNGPKNSNGYWTKNAYQVDPVRGSLSDFRELQVELFKKGMGFIADGAFVNESWEGIHLKDIMKHGPKSPFYNWFMVSDSDQKLRPELLPDKNNPDALQNAGIKIINGNFSLEYDGDNIKVVKNTDYNEDLPTKIQIFDRRFASEEQQNSDELIQTYDIKELNDPNKVKSFSDSVQPVSFEVDPQKIKKAFKPINELEQEDIIPLIKDSDWGRYFELAFPGEGSNISPWDGQKDIMKLRFFVTKTEEIKLSNKPARVKELQKASSQVQDNTVQVGQYWTAETEKTLTEYTAGQLKEKLKEKNYKEIKKDDYKEKARVLKEAINELARESKIPRESVKLINAGQLENLLQSDYDRENSSYTGEYNMPIAPLPGSIAEGLMSQPLEAIEFPDEICSVLASPYIKKLAPEPELIGVSRYDFVTGSDYSKELIEYNRQTGGVFEKANKVFLDDNKMSGIAAEIINQSAFLKRKMIKNHDELTKEGREILRVIAGDITKYLVIKALSGVEPDKDSLKEGKALSYSPEKLKDIEKNLYINWRENGNRRESSPEAEADSLIEALSRGLAKNISDKDMADFSKYLEKRVKKIDGETLKVSKLILNRTESGMEWRIDAARDVADMSTIQSEQAPRMKNTFNDSWDRVIDFWGRFINGVKEQNPRYYAIAESSNLHIAYAGEPKKHKDHSKSCGNYPTLGSVTQKFLEMTGFTTDSNYAYLFGLIPSLTTASFEKGSAFDDVKKKLLEGWEAGIPGEVPGFLKSAPVDSVLFSHVFTDNHDMMRSLHVLSINKSEYDNGIGLKKERLERWQGTKIGEKLEKLAEANEVKKKALQDIKDIFDEAFGKADKQWWIDSLDDEGRWNFVLDNWNKEWVAKDGRIRASGLTDEYKSKKKKIEKKFNGLGQLGIAAYNTRIIKEKYTSAVLAADTILNSADKAINDPAVKIPQDKREPLINLVKQAIDNLATGSSGGRQDDDLPQVFGSRSVKHNWQDIMAEARYLDKNVFTGIPSVSLNKLAVKVHQNFVKPGMDRMKAIELYKTLFGSPTMYTGEETAETGLESYGKNKYLTNRNRVHFERLNSPDYRYVQEYKKELQKIFSLRKKPNLSPLVNGQYIMLPVVKSANDEENKSIVGLYRYNRERDVIAIFNTAGFGPERSQSKVTPQTIPFLDTAKTDKFGIEGGIEDNVVYINALNENDKYITEGGKLYKKGNNGEKQQITITEPALILYREEIFS